IEKAHPDVFNILLQMLEEGRLTDAQGRQVDFKNTIVIMTSNIGASQINKNTSIGFTLEETETGVSHEDMKNKIMGELRKVFRPELLNRIDEVIVFQKLTRDEIKLIVDQLMKRVREQLKVHEVSIELTDASKEFMVDKGYDPTMGARPLRRAIQRYIEDPLADFVLGRNIEPGSTVLVDWIDGDEEISLQMIEPVEVPDAPPEDLVPTPADDAKPEDSGDDEPEQPAEPAE
ncbi:MAG: AAA family ATPase, partial [Gaiellales bacterium]